GACSPSRSVVSKTRTLSIACPTSNPPSTARASHFVQFIWLANSINHTYAAVEAKPPMDLAELNVFLTVARERSFSRAAQKLYRTQPAVSIAVRKLEESVGEPLFARGSRSGQLTDAGKLLANYAERMLNLREEITRAMSDLRTGRRGELSLGVNESSIH